MLLELLRKHPMIKNWFLNWLDQNWVAEKAQRILPFLEQDQSVLDIGAGNGLLARHLLQKGFQVQAVDVANLAIPEEISITVYDGQHLPFADQSYATALLITVLHHTDDPVVVLRETARVASKIVIIEDVYRNTLQKYLTFGMDTLVNLGHSNMTYQNRSTKEWLALFETLGLSLLEHREKRVLGFFRQATFVLTVSPPPASNATTTAQ
ncbi:MAG: class I SAM-dependent methyltransferase [Bacteroidota bacterium]